MRTFKRIVLGVLIVLAAGVAFAWWYDHTGQKPDPNFDVHVATPAYSVAGLHPKVMIDEGHRNFHTASGRYKPFADLLLSDGYLIASNVQPFAADTLKGVDILVITNAMGPDGHETRPAFTPEEEGILVRWVNDGGSEQLMRRINECSSQAGGETVGIAESGKLAASF